MVKPLMTVIRAAVTQGVIPFFYKNLTKGPEIWPYGV
jgi:hypothetical protein